MLEKTNINFNINIEYSTETISLLNGDVLDGNRERLVLPRIQRIHVQVSL